MFGQPEITREKIKCEECGKWFKKITSAHLKMHGMTIPEYKERWGFLKNQPLEAGYITELRQEQSKELGHADRLKTWQRDNPSLAEKHRFKKGNKCYYSEHEVPEQLRKRLEGMAVNVQGTDEFKKKISKASKKMWKNKEYRKKITNTLKKRYEDPDERERLGNQSREFWKDDGNRKAMSEQRKKIWNTPSKKKFASERAKKMWKDPEKRAQILKTRELNKK
jgi:hypothetical protein